MDCLFENRYTKNEKWTKECWKYIVFYRPIVIVTSCIAILYFIGMIINPICAVVPIVWFFCIFVMYNMNVKLSLKRDLEMFGKTTEVISYVYDDYIEQHLSSGTVVKLHYDDIKKVKQTKKYIFINSKAKMVYTIANESFCKGTKEEFFTFLKSKSVKGIK